MVRYATAARTLRTDPNTGLIINGVATSLDLGFERLNGSSIGGVMISTVVTMPFEQGVLTLDGPINSFVIGGVELWIDDVSITVVPEPSTAALLIVAGIPLFARRRTRRV